MRLLRTLMFFSFYVILCAQSHAQKKIFWADTSDKYINKADLDGGNQETIQDLSANSENLASLAIDPKGEKVYWTAIGISSGIGTINRAGFDGKNLENILPSTFDLGGIFVDSDNGKIYWTEGTDSTLVMRADLDGSNSELVFDNGLSGGPKQISLDIAAGKIYYTQDNSPALIRADLDGSNKETLATGSPSGVSLDITNGKVYWSDESSNIIYRADLDGTNSETIISASGGAKFIALDLINNKLYWSSVSPAMIRRADLDGANIEDILTSAEGLRSATGLAVIGKASILRPDTTIEDAPEVSVTDRRVTLTLKEFSEATDVSLAAQIAQKKLKLTTQTASFTFRYDVRLSSSSSNDNRRRVTKRNQVTFRNLNVGSYTARYRATIFQRRSASGRRRAEQNGKTGLNARFRRVASTGFSPSASFNISN